MIINSDLYQVDFFSICEKVFNFNVLGSIGHTIFSITENCPTLSEHMNATE